MEPTRPKISVKDFFLSIGATVALYTVVITLVTLLFTVINFAFPMVTNSYMGSSSISWSVSMLFVFTPILILLMWLLEKQYTQEPERKDSGVHKWLTYLTLFLAGFAVAGDLVSVIYYFIDGRELSTAFLLKCAVLLVVAGSLFGYYLSDVRGRLQHKGRVMWRVVSVLVVIASVIWAFSVLGSPRTQRLYKYDEQKISDLMNIDSSIQNYYSTKKSLPKNFTELSQLNYYINTIDPQKNVSYEYKVNGPLIYELCAEFNKSSDDKTQVNRTYPYGGSAWSHPAGRYCFQSGIDGTPKLDGGNPNPVLPMK